MIPLDLFDYTEKKEIDIKVTEYINENISEILRLLIDILKDDWNNEVDGFSLDMFFPRDYLMNNPKECRKLVDELYEIAQCNIIRDYIEPKYEYLLYMVLTWWKDINEDQDNLIIVDLNDELYKEILIQELYLDEEGNNYISSVICNFDSYLEFCFFDYDFLPETLTRITMFYLEDSNLFRRLYPDTDLIEYLDLMPCDLKKRYINTKQSYDIEKQDGDTEKELILEFQAVLNDFENRVAEIESRNEVEISNDIYSSINRVLKCKWGISSSREMTIGRAIKDIGETDLYLYKSNRTGKHEYAIIENKLIENFESQYRQLLGYLNPNFELGITISINKKLNLTKAIEKIKDTLENIKMSDRDFKITDIEQPFEKYKSIILSSHILPEDESKEMRIYHLILNLYDRERKEIARKARGKFNIKSVILINLLEYIY